MSGSEFCYVDLMPLSEKEMTEYYGIPITLCCGNNV